jgi:hypothetical protein
MIVMREILNVKQNARPSRKPRRIGRARRNEGREKGYEMPGEICGFRADRRQSVQKAGWAKDFPGGGSALSRNLPGR